LYREKSEQALNSYMLASQHVSQRERIFSCKSSSSELTRPYQWSSCLRSYPGEASGHQDMSSSYPCSSLGAVFNRSERQSQRLNLAGQPVHILMCMTVTMTTFFIYVCFLNSLNFYLFFLLPPATRASGVRM
jgi:hypothetical protein